MGFETRKNACKSRKISERPAKLIKLGQERFKALRGNYGFSESVRGFGRNLRGSIMI